MPRVAVIDIGTITARLCVADVEAGRVTRMIKKSSVCNLGAGVDSTGLISPDAMTRTLACVKQYVEALKTAGAEAACCTLTSAARDAKNASVLGYSLHALGLDPIIIPGDLEAALTFLGVSSDFFNTKILVADNGGGSTELACGRFFSNGSCAIDAVFSTDAGARRVRDRFFKDCIPPSAKDLEQAHRYAYDLFATACELNKPYFYKHTEGLTLDTEQSSPDFLVVCGGTATSLVAIRDGLVPYDPARVHLSTLSFDDLKQAESQFKTMSLSELGEIRALQKGRLDLILSGTVVLAELLNATGFDQMYVSESDLLFGLSLCADAAYTNSSSPLMWKPSITLCKNLLQ